MRIGDIINTIEAKLRLFVSMMRSFSRRTETTDIRSYLRNKDNPRRYGLVLENRVNGGSQILAKITFFFKPDGKFTWRSGMGSLGKDIDTVLVTDLDTILCLRRGTYKTKDGRNLSYNFDSAIRFGDIKWRGEASTTDIQRFRILLDEHPEVIDTLVPKV